MNEEKPVFDTTHRLRRLWLSVLTDESGMTKQAVKRRLIFRSVKKTLNGVDDFGVENTPDTDRVAIMLLPESIQEPIDGLGFRLKSFKSVAINPSKVCVLHTFLAITICSVKQVAIAEAIQQASVSILGTLILPETGFAQGQAAVGGDAEKWIIQFGHPFKMIL